MECQIYVVYEGVLNKPEKKNHGWITALTWVNIHHSTSPESWSRISGWGAFLTGRWQRLNATVLTSTGRMHLPWADCGGMVLTPKRKGRRKCSSAVKRQGMHFLPRSCSSSGVLNRVLLILGFPVPWLMTEKRHLSFSSCPSSENKCVILKVWCVTIEPLYTSWQSSFYESSRDSKHFWGAKQYSSSFSSLYIGRYRSMLPKASCYLGF